MDWSWFITREGLQGSSHILCLPAVGATLRLSYILGKWFHGDSFLSSKKSLTVAFGSGQTRQKQARRKHNADI